LLLPLLLSSSTTGRKDNSNLKIITWNIRYNNSGDGVNAWPNRKDKVTALLKTEHPQVFCLQEVLAGQLDDVAHALPGYAWFGAGRDDGKKEGEYVPVFYLRSRYRQLLGDHFWLSESPRKPGVLGWDAACTRMVTWVKLLDRISRDTLFIFNTHFDHIGVTARLMSARMLTRAVDSLAKNQPVVITGDFNSTTADSPYQVITAAGLPDARTLTSTRPAGPDYTFTGFDITGKPGDRIDFIFLRNRKPVQTYVVRDDSSNGFYLSDHLPVIITL
jgi:endonuclease/exonuclease/phosphatase family metal-dependent hydrolase